MTLTASLQAYGDALLPRYTKVLRRYRFRPGIATVDFVLSAVIPWSDPQLRRAPKQTSRLVTTHSK
ncbi:hypothetical protein [Mycobacterium uberis]|uniref:hypothetical protein n=1 Tax=Mycobacterium uberis TaxID=2162698 RepID=UPI001402F983|nr:hypothetical protein [Mycobacterium uberis]